MKRVPKLNLGYVGKARHIVAAGVSAQDDDDAIVVLNESIVGLGGRKKLNLCQENLVKRYC
jgi:hypothetical protein